MAVRRHPEGRNGRQRPRQGCLRAHGPDVRRHRAPVCPGQTSHVPTIGGALCTRVIDGRVSHEIGHSPQSLRIGHLGRVRHIGHRGQSGQMGCGSRHAPARGTPHKNFPARAARTHAPGAKFEKSFPPRLVTPAKPTFQLSASASPLTKLHRGGNPGIVPSSPSPRVPLIPAHRRHPVLTTSSPCPNRRSVFAGIVATERRISRDRA